MSGVRGTGVNSPVDESDAENEVLEMIRRGTYFNHAYDWYCVKYLKCVSDLHYSLLLGVVCFLFVILNLSNIYTLLPTSYSMPFVKYVDDEEDEIHIMKRIGVVKSEVPELDLSQYLVANYVTVREKYDYSLLEEQRAYVENNSAYKVYSEFLDYMNLSNRNGPLSKYKYNGRRDVEVVSVKVSHLSKALRSNEANVRLKVVDFDGEVKKTYYEQVQLSFTLSDVYMAKEGLIPLEFVVDRYVR